VLQCVSAREPGVLQCVAVWLQRVAAALDGVGWLWLVGSIKS